MVNWQAFRRAAGGLAGVRHEHAHQRGDQTGAGPASNAAAGSLAGSYAQVFRYRARAAEMGADRRTNAAVRGGRELQIRVVASEHSERTHADRPETFAAGR